VLFRRATWSRYRALDAAHWNNHCVTGRKNAFFAIF
jgi:hypothetical protein